MMKSVFWYTFIFYCTFIIVVYSEHFTVVYTKFKKYIFVYNLHFTFCMHGTAYCDDWNITLYMSSFQFTYYLFLVNS